MRAWRKKQAAALTGGGGGGKRGGKGKKKPTTRVTPPRWEENEEENEEDVGGGGERGGEGLHDGPETRRMGGASPLPPFSQCHPPGMSPISMSSLSRTLPMDPLDPVSVANRLSADNEEWSRAAMEDENLLAQVEMRVLETALGGLAGGELVAMGRTMGRATGFLPQQPKWMESPCFRVDYPDPARLSASRLDTSTKLDLWEDAMDDLVETFEGDNESIGSESYRSIIGLK